MINRNKVIAGLLAVITGFSFAMPATKAYAFDSSIDYKTALKDAVVFYDANKCGPNAGDNNFFDWRGACHCDDGKSMGIDLTGGFHDAGDFVKFGLPGSYAASVMGWALYEFKDGFQKAGMYNKQLDETKYFTDYIMKCHYAPGKFVYEVGEGNKDHDYWASPEKQTVEQGARNQIKVADSSHPAADVIGESVAALSIMYLNCKDIDSDYAEKCLQHAKELYQMGKSNLRTYEFNQFYESKSCGDDMAWAAAWLYDITRDKSYLSDAERFIKLENQWLETGWTMCWNDMKVAAELKLYQLTKDSQYKKAMDHNLNCWKNMNPVAGGVKVYDGWGSLRYTAAESMIALIYNKVCPDRSLVDTAASQIDYILGKNPSGMSYMVGFGNKYPQHAHHRAANGYDKLVDANYKYKDNKHVLTGALVGGPDGGGTFVDELDKYTYTEVAIDYNAGFVGALAGCVSLNYQNNTSELFDSPFGPGKIDPPPTEKLAGDVNGDKQVNISDYTLLKKYINTGGAVKINENNSDINNDGTVSFLDLLALKKLV